MSEKTETVKWTYWLHLAIGMFFMFVFPRLTPFEPVTEVGMAVMGVFIGMVYLWSTMDSIWPSMLGLLLVGISGYVPELQGYAAVKDLFLNAFGTEHFAVQLLLLGIGAAFYLAVTVLSCKKACNHFEKIDL